MANPILGSEVFSSSQSPEASMIDSGEVMTLGGTINKSLFLLLLAAIGATLVRTGPLMFLIPMYIPLILVGAGLAFVIIFKKTLAPLLAPVYALLEGVILGVISVIFEAMYPGIVLQAIGLTLSIFFVMLIAYRLRLLQATPGFVKGVVFATGAIMLMYVVSLVGMFAGVGSIPFLHEGGFIGIAVSIFIVSIAALNFIIDFDLVEKGVANRAPKYLEWYASFGLLVTLVWLYFEVIRLLGKLQSE